MRRFALLLSAATLFAFNAPAWAEDLTLASFNVRIYSTGSRSDAELEKIADRFQQFDFIAVQEVRDQEVVDRTLAILAGRGHTYQAIVSEPVGRGVKERYAFLWRADRAQPVDAGRLYPDPEDAFIREPFAASFRAGSFDFTLATIHAIFGDNVAGRRAEALLLDDVYRNLQDTDPNEQDVLILGDFNLPPEDEGFAELRQLLTPLFTGDIRTTISDASLYDNIWFEPQYVKEFTGQIGVDRYDETVFGGDDDAASLAVSDHRPIWAVFNTGGPDDDGASGATAVPESTWGEVKQIVEPTAVPAVVPVPLSVQRTQESHTSKAKVATTRQESSAAATDTVYVTRTGKKYHQASCRYLSKSKIPMSLKDAAARYTPCSVCDPPMLEAQKVEGASKKAVPAVSGQCQAITKKGTQCKRKAEPGSIYCWQHGGR
jgi:endonuclease/exonuclease/phosphatase family metal-dependent hydrolase